MAGQPMDRQIVHAIFFALVCTGLLGLFFFAGEEQSGRTNFAPDDIRFKAEKETLKSQKRKKAVKAAPSSSASDSAEEPESEEPPAEEPPIE